MRLPVAAAMHHKDEISSSAPACSFACCSTTIDIAAWLLMSSVASKRSLDNNRVHRRNLLPSCRPTPRRSNCQPGNQHTHHSAQLTDKIVHDTVALSRRYVYVRELCDHAHCSRMRMITHDLAELQVKPPFSCWMRCRSYFT